MNWEYDPPADEKQKRQKYLLTEQIKNSKHKLTLRDKEPKVKIKEEVIEIVKRPDTPMPVYNPRDLWTKELQEQTRKLMTEIEQELTYPHSENHYLGSSKKRRRKRKSNDVL
ncbi:MAG: hypothetical protein ACYSUC_12120 [Planctomycetota bacterium]